MRFAALVVLLLVGSTAVALAGRSAGDFDVNPGFQVPDQTFPDCCPKPDWREQVEAPVIGSLEEFFEVWQSKTLKKRQRAKSLFQAALDHVGRNDEIAAKAVIYYRVIDPKYPKLKKLLEFGVVRPYSQSRLRKKMTSPPPTAAIRAIASG